MREGWKAYRLGDLVDSKRGISYGIVQPGQFLKEGGVPIIKVNNLTESKTELGDLFRVSKEIESKYERTRLRGDEILVSLVGSLGHVFKTSEMHKGWNVVRAIGVLPIKNGINRDWIYWYLKCQIIQTLFQNLATVTVQATLNLKELREIEIPIPDEETQCRITTILSALDDKIELNRQANQTLEAIAQALFKEWFVDFNFPGATGEMQESELGPIPVGWEISTLKNLTVKIGSGATPRGGSGVYLDEGTALIRSQNVYDSEFVWDGLARISDEAAEQLRNVEVKKEDVLLNITGASILRTCVVVPEVLPARVNQHVAIIRANSGISSRYIHLHLLQQKTKDYLMALDAGGSREAVTKGHIELVPILKPPLNVLARFDTVTSSIYLEIEQLSSQIRALASIRDILLPKLMSGVISV